MKNNKACADCRYHKAESYHDKMWCRDCTQKDKWEHLMSELRECPCDPSCKCLMDEPCYGCETYGEWLKNKKAISESKGEWVSKEDAIRMIRFAYDKGIDWTNRHRTKNCMSVDDVVHHLVPQKG